MKKNIQLLLFMLVFVKITVAQLPNYVPTNGLVAFWPFNGNANDVSGNGNNGIVFGATLTTNRFGNINTAFQFNGINNRIMVNDSGDQLDLINDFTISSFFNLSNNIPAGSIAMILAKRSNTISNINGALAGYGIWDVNDGSGREVIALEASSNAGPQNYPTSAGDIQTNRWYHFVATYNKSTDTLIYYLDGIKVFSKCLPLGITNTTYDLSIGSISNIGYYFSGKIDDIGIWNRALTQQEITNLYTACADTFNNQPVSVVGAKGTNCNFSSSITGTGNNYQWQSNAANLGWQNVPNSNPYVGSNTNNLSVNGLTVSNHNQRFRVIASKSGCADTSNVVSITVSDIASDSLALLTLKSDTTTKGNRIRQLEIDLANNRDTLYVGSNITTDTLIISIRTGLSMSSSLLNTLRVYPNPAATVINVELQKPGTYIAKISGITGQTIVTQTAGTIDISTLASGVYVLSIFDTNNKLVSTNKISVVR